MRPRRAGQPIGVALMVIDEGTKLDQAFYAKSIVIEGMSFFDVRKVSTPLDPGMDLSPTQENEQELNSSSVPYDQVFSTR